MFDKIEQQKVFCIKLKGHELQNLGFYGNKFSESFIRLEIYNKVMNLCFFFKVNVSKFLLFFF